MTTSRTETWRHSLIALGTAALLLGGFLKVTWEFRQGRVTTPDEAIMISIAEHRHPSLTIGMKFLTDLGSPLVLGVVSGLGLIFFYLRDRYREAGYLALAGIGTSIFIFAVKNFISRPRPSHVELLVQSGGYSFPSGHTLSSTSIYLFLAFLLAFQIKGAVARLVLLGAALGFSLGIGFTRVYLAAHYPSDVVGGFFLGFAWASFLAALYLKPARQLAK